MCSKVKALAANRTKYFKLLLAHPIKCDTFDILYVHRYAISPKKTQTQGERLLTLLLLDDFVCLGFP